MSGGAPTPCDGVRRDIVAAGPLGEAARAHLGDCRPCRLFAARLAIVDDALESETGHAAEARIATALRARISAAAFPTPRVVGGGSARTPTTHAARGILWIDVAVRLAAVAAVLVAAIASMPESALAGDLPLREILAFDGGLRAPLPVPAVPADLSALADGGSLLSDAGGATTLSLAAVVLLLAAGLSRRVRR